ncbi:MAG TPA: zf-HC2 domain-containing protein, partial [Pirellulaceae bacterium]|nr:zf-HC2 domain-containing protein [Pirellulaceae bacterium]
MNRACLEIEAQLSAWLDGELSPAQAESVRLHLSECAECQAVVEALEQLDEAFVDCAARDESAAARIADNVILALGQNGATRESTERAPSRGARSGGIGPRLRQLASLLLAAAAGFFLAWLIFAPSGRRFVDVARPTSNSTDSIGGESGDSSSQPGERTPSRTTSRATPTLARLVAATGAVEWRGPGTEKWSVVADAASFRCSIGTELRTGPGVRCELETGDRCTVRLNEATELAVRSSREIELRAGQVWCSSEGDVELNVVAARFAPSESTASAQPLRFSCAVKSAAVSEIDKEGGCRVQGAGGEIDVRFGEERHRLKQGEVARFESGRLVIESHHADSLLSTSWMQPLLVQKGHDSPELGERVDRLLAHLGRSKLENLYENEIRSLGDYAVLPMLRFVQSESSRSDPNQRQRAMRIVSDIAPSWLIGDLIELLADADADVRVLSALAL